jgi:ketopantoate reductase
VADRIFARNLKKVRMSSMGQDVYVLKRGATELESLNGYFVRLADSVGFDARYNRRLYAITREWLAQPDIRPMHEAELWARLDQA